MAVTAEQALNVFRGELGKDPYEIPAFSNQTKYGKAYGFDGVAWCAIFQWWGLVLKSALNHIKSAYTPTVAEWYRAQGRFGKEPKVGALVFFNFPDSLDRIQHIGIVERIDTDTVTTIEGNTSAGSLGSQDDGGGVYRRKRNRDSSIVGYAYPNYLPKPLKPVFDFPVKAWFGRGDSGADVKVWQKHLNRYFATKKPPEALNLEVTKKFDTPTAKATKQFQHEQGLDVDGRVGQLTLRKMEAILEKRRP